MECNPAAAVAAFRFPAEKARLAAERPRWKRPQQRSCVAWV